MRPLTIKMIIFLQKKPRKIKIRPLVPPTNMTPAHHPTMDGCDRGAAAHAGARWLNFSGVESRLQIRSLLVEEN